jgi:hypothetical protein
MAGVPKETILFDGQESKHSALYAINSDELEKVLNGTVNYRNDGVVGSVVEVENCGYLAGEGDGCNSVGSSRGSVGSFRHVNKKARRSNGCGLSDVLGCELKSPLPLCQKTKAVGQKSKFVLEEDILNTDIADADVTLRKEHSGVPGSSDYKKNMVLATSPLDDKFGFASHKIIVKSQD